MNHRTRKFLLRLFGIAVIVLAALFAGGFFSAQRACAHDPRFACSPRSAANPVQIADPQKSWAFYGHLRNGQADAYRISVTRPVSVSWSLLVDERDAGNSARPAATLTDASGRVITALKFDSPRVFYEPFSRESYLTTATVTIPFRPGIFQIRVEMHGGTQPQRYTMAIGSDERFSITEIPYVLGAITRIRARKY